MTRDASLCGDACNEARKFLETKRDIPRINGSSKAFIVIIACLVFIIIAACAAILFLLRNQRAFEIEQARRSKREQPINPLPFSNAVARSTWSSTIVAFCRQVFEKIRYRAQKRRETKGGWVRAESWEGDTGASVPGQSGVRGVASAGPSSLQNIHTSHSLSTLSRNISGSLSSLRLDGNETRGPQIILPLSNLPSIEFSESSPSTSPQSSNIHLPTLSSDSIPDHVQFDDDSREYVGLSGRLMRTLRGGTKFVEGF